MATYAYRLVNVFAEAPLAGNPLCVFEDARGMDDATMQALALQFNLSETTFVLPSRRATAHVRIFTPSFEMPFAGHPTLGSAHVVRALMSCGDALTLEMRAGIIPVVAAGDVWTLAANAPRHRSVELSRERIAAMLGLRADDVAPDPERPPLWVDTGSDQLIIPLASAEAVARTKPDGQRLLADGHNGTRAMVYGGWLLATGTLLPRRLAIAQGDAVGRPCRLGLEVSAERQIRVSGRVIELGRGTIAL